MERLDRIYSQLDQQGHVEGPDATTFATDFGPAAEMRGRAMMLASWVASDDLRREIREAIKFISPTQTVLEGTLIELDAEATWQRATRASDAIGEQLRSGTWTH